MSGVRDGADAAHVGVASGMIRLDVLDDFVLDSTLRRDVVVTWRDLVSPVVDDESENMSPMNPELADRAPDFVVILGGVGVNSGARSIEERDGQYGWPLLHRVPDRQPTLVMELFAFTSLPVATWEVQPRQPGVTLEDALNLVDGFLVSRFGRKIVGFDLAEFVYETSVGNTVGFPGFRVWWKVFPDPFARRAEGIPPLAVSLDDGLLRDGVVFRK